MTQAPAQLLTDHSRMTLVEREKPFADAAEAVLIRLRASVGQFVHSAPSPIERAADLQHALGVDASLGWQVFRLATAATPLAAAPFVPHPPSMRKVLRLAKVKGFAESAVAAVAACYAEFVELVDRYAGNRRAFDAMISALEEANPEQPNLRLRRSVYRGNSDLWGFHSKAIYWCSIRHPGSRKQMEHSAVVCGHVGLQQLRPSSPITLLRRTSMKYRSPGHDALERIAEGEEGAPRLELLDEFCSKPFPTLEVTQDAKGIRDTIRLEGVGRVSTVTCFATDVLRDLKTETEDLGWGSLAPVSAPCETLVVDLLVPCGWADLSSMGTETLGNASDIAAMAADPFAFPLPIKEEAVYLGNNLEAMHDADIPRCPALIRAALERMDWADTEYDLFRCRVKYPILNTAVTVYVDAPKAI